MTLCHFSEDLNLHLYCCFLSHHMWAEAQRHGTRSASVQVSTVSTLKMFLIISAYNLNLWPSKHRHDSAMSFILIFVTLWVSVQKLLLHVCLQKLNQKPD